MARLSSTPLPDLDPEPAPWPARTEVVDGCGLRVRRAAPSAGPREPAVFVHGLGGDSTNWTDLMGLLTPWLDGIAPDLPGFGGSDPAPGGDYSLRRQALTVVRLLERRGPPVHLFGNSMGGAASVLVAANRPDLVRTLTLVAPAMPDLRPRKGPSAPLQALLLPGAVPLVDRYLARFTPEQRVQAMVTACFGAPSAIPEWRLAEAAEEVRRRVDLPWNTPALVRSLRGLVASYVAVGARNMWRQAARVTAPTLVVWGGRDQLVSAALAPRTTRTIPGARLLMLPQCGHVPQLEDPVSLARAFLALREDAATAPSPAAGSGEPERLAQ